MNTFRGARPRESGDHESTKARKHERHPTWREVFPSPLGFRFVFSCFRVVVIPLLTDTLRTPILPLRRAFRTATLLAAATVLLPPVGQASLSAAQPDNLARREETQKRVRAMARDLVSGVLESQLRQLEENDLTSTQWYRDISLMRKNLDALIEAEMPKVVELLGRLPAASGKEREDTFVQARKKSREILVELLTQRQSVLRRLRMAEMAAQVRQLIARQTKVLRTTESLPEKTPSEREAAMVPTAEDQRDIKEMFLKLEDVLKDVANWGGEVGAEAAGALRLIETGRVESELNTAVRSVEQAQFPKAAESQKNVIRVLEALLKTVERVQGLLKEDRSAVQRAIEELAQRQKELREATSQPDLAPQDTEQLRERQDAVKGDLAELGKQAEETPAAEPLQEARKAAEEATAKLFEGKPGEALAQQDKVLENLEKAARQVQQAAPPSPALKPDQLAKAISDLEAAKRDVEKIQAEQKQASTAAKDKPQDAQRQESQIAQELGEVPRNRTLPQPVTERLGEAKEAASDAAGAMDRPQPDRRDATQRAEQAIQRAAAEIDAALADARRRQLAQNVQQLAAAAQSLEQAAAQEHRIAQEAQQAAEGPGLSADHARDLGQQQAGVQKTAADVAQAVEQAAPETSKLLSEAAKPMQQAAGQLQAAQQQPGEASGPAATEAGKQAQDAASKLSQAAEKLRQELGREGRQLAQMADRQLQAAQQVQEAVQNAMAARPESIAKRLERLAQAEEKVRQAAADQQRAAGRPEAAQAMDLAAGIRKALQKQDAADRAARALNKRPDASPLEAVTKQEDVAQSAGQLAKEASGQAQGQEQDRSSPIAEELQRAEKAAHEAARDVLTAKAHEAQSARAETRKALREALRLADEQAAHTAEPPSGKPDAAAQARVGQEAAAARELAEPDAPQAAQTLGEAGKTSAEAQKQLAGDQPQAAAPAQQSTANALEQAAAQLAEAKAQLAQKAADQMAATAEAAGRLADQAARVDPGATAALQAAENLAAQAAAAIPQTPQAAAPAEQGVGEAMEQAAGELGAREQQLLQDRALAAALGVPNAQQANHPSDRSSPIIGGGGMARSGQLVRNQAAPQMPLQPTSRQPQGDSRTGDAANPAPEGGERASGEKPWMADLPPEVRGAIRVNSQRRPPRGYEEILRRYFKNLD